MSPLRQRMITAMQMHGFSPRTHQSYLCAVEDLVRFTGQAPQALGPEDLRGYFEHLVTVRRLAPASVRLAYSGIRFLYCEVLGWPAVDLAVTLPARPQRIPELLTRAEVAAILAACARERDAMVLALTYACGLRLSEVVSLRVTDIDGERRLLRVRQGKGAKDRLVPLSPREKGDRPPFLVRLCDRHPRQSSTRRMPRRARIIAAGYPMHVILRGIDRAAIFFDDGDYRFLLDTLAEAARQEGVSVHAYGEYRGIQGQTTINCP